MKTSKLTLKKEKLATLSQKQMSSIAGGGAAGSTKRNFTCGLCTNTTIDTKDILTATIAITTKIK